jgi:hypothetical protein
MKLWTCGILLCVCTSGCVSPQIIPNQSFTTSIRSIGVIPVEGRPLTLHPQSDDDKKAIDAMAAHVSRVGELSVSWLSVGALGSVAGRALSPQGPVMLAEAAAAGTEVPGEAAVFEKGRPRGTWSPTLEFAKSAVPLLRQVEGRQVRLIDGYVTLPFGERLITWHMEEWLGPIRRFYNSDASAVDYAAIDTDRVDAILEVGMVNFEYLNERLLLQVFVRLIDPRTVLGRAREWSYLKGGPLAPLLQNDAEGLKRLVVTTGDALVVKCIGQIRLNTK